jgi:uncharacterized membrane protein HdeD (DUF308 family)
MSSLYGISSASMGAGTRLAQSWGWLLFRGIIAILFGLSAILMPIAALGSLALIFAAYLLIDGVAAIGCGIEALQAHGRWMWFIVEGALGIAAGIGIALLPGAAILGLITLAAAWALVSGGALVTAAVRMHRGHGRWLMVLSGMISIVWGALLFLSPVSGAIVLAIWLGAYALIFGAMMIFLAFHVRDQQLTVNPALTLTP